MTRALSRILDTLHAMPASVVPSVTRVGDMHLAVTLGDGRACVVALCAVCRYVTAPGRTVMLRGTNWTAARLAELKHAVNEVATTTKFED